MKKRPVGFTLISIFLAWLSLAGILNAVMRKGNIIFSFIAAVYGITALVAAVGLWKIKEWSITAYLLWCASVILTAIMMQLSYQYQAPLYIFLPFSLFVILLLGGGAFYIHRKLKFIVAEQGNPADR